MQRILSMVGPGVLALAVPVLAQSSVRFDTASLPFLDPASGAIEVQLQSVRLSPDGSTVYGSVGERFAIEGEPFQTRLVSTPWRWSEGDGFEVLDLSDFVTAGARINFSRPTADGSLVQVWSDGPFGHTNGLLTPDGPASVRTYTNNAFFDQLRHISADGTTLLESDLYDFSTWTAANGERRVSIPIVGDFGHAARLSSDGSRVVGFSADIASDTGSIWIYDEADGFSVVESDNGWLAPNGVSNDATVIAGQRLIDSEGRSGVFVWDAEGGLRDLTPEGVVFGAVTGISGDGRVIGYTYLEQWGDIEGDQRRLSIRGLGDFEFAAGLEALGYDLSEDEPVLALDFSSDARSLLALDADGSVVLLRSAVPAPGAAVLLVLAAGLGTRRRRRTA